KTPRGNRGVFWFVRSLDGAQRNPGPLLADKVTPDCAALHPGYAFTPAPAPWACPGSVQSTGPAWLQPNRLSPGRPPAPRPTSGQVQSPAGPAQAWLRSDWPSASAPRGSQHEEPAVAAAARPGPDPALGPATAGPAVVEP